MICCQKEDYQFSEADIVEVVKKFRKEMLLPLQQLPITDRKVSARRQFEIMGSKNLRGAIFLLRSLLYMFVAFSLFERDFAPHIIKKKLSILYYNFDFSIFCGQGFVGFT